MHEEGPPFGALDCRNELKRFSFFSSSVHLFDSAREPVVLQSVHGTLEDSSDANHTSRPHAELFFR